MFALIVVPGASVWNWVRTNILFGVFGVGSYVLAPMLLYIAVLVACERPVKGKLAKALLVLMLVCGTFLIFSKTDLTGLGFWEGMAVLRSTRRVGMGARRRHAGRGVRLDAAAAVRPPGGKYPHCNPSC